MNWNSCWNLKDMSNPTTKQVERSNKHTQHLQFGIPALDPAMEGFQGYRNANCTIVRYLGAHDPVGQDSLWAHPV